MERALTMWSAVAASAYVGGLAMANDYEPQHDSQLQQRMIASLSQSFGDIMGEDPGKPE